MTAEGKLSITREVREALFEVMVHPVRFRVFSAVCEREGVTAREISTRLDLPSRSVRHHLDWLLQAELIEPSEISARRGAQVHHYSSRYTPFIAEGEDGVVLEGDEDEVPFDEEGERRLALAVLRLLIADTRDAVRNGTFGSHSRHVEVRVPAHVDERGWNEASEILTRALAELMAVRETSAERLRESGEEGFEAIAGLLLFKATPWSDSA